MKLFNLPTPVRIIILSFTVAVLPACGGSSDSSGSVSQNQVITQPMDNQTLKKVGIFSVKQDGVTVVMDGTIGSKSLRHFQKILANYPNINTINIRNCDGSTDDETNLRLSKLVFDNKINIHIMDNGTIASGGTDFFLAGVKRTKGANTRIGVHSWGGDGDEIASDFPRGHANHLPYINYYESIGMTRQQAEDFYYFTIDSAPADSIHWMTEVEISKYNLLTQ